MSHGKWESLHDKVAVAKFDLLADDPDEPKCKLAHRNAKVHVCGASHGGAFFGLVKLDRYEENMFTDDLYVTVIPTPHVDNATLRAALHAHKLIARAQAAHAKPEAKLALIDAFSSAKDDATRRGYAEALTFAQLDFQALTAQQAALKQAQQAALARMSRVRPARGDGHYSGRVLLAVSAFESDRPSSVRAEGRGERRSRPRQQSLDVVSARDARLRISGGRPE